MFQPGAILHEVIVGAFKTSGTSFEAWCNENDVHTSTARTATYGQSGGDKGQAMLERYQLIARSGAYWVRDTKTARDVSDTYRCSQQAELIADTANKAARRALRKVRKCMVCGEEFMSQGLHHRLCAPCRRVGASDTPV